MTGARLGEVLHMEWEDFDEKMGSGPSDQNLGALPSTSGMETEMG